LDQSTDQDNPKQTMPADQSKTLTTEKQRCKAPLKGYCKAVGGLCSWKSVPTLSQVAL